MNTRSVLQTLVAGCLLICGCSSAEIAEQIPPVSETSLRNGKDDKAIRELQRLYAEAKTESARRALCLRAIDGGLIRQGGPVFTIDQILGTHYDGDFRLEERTEKDVVLFADQPPVPQFDPPRIVAMGSFGSYMVFEYDSKGVLRDYYLSNLHKGHSSRKDGKAPLPVEELRQAFASAKTEAERRDVCLLAIDEGVIQTGGPVPVSTVDAIFGTHLASDLPSRKEESRRAVVDLSGPYPAAAGALGKVTTRDGSWLIVVEYAYDGNIWSYYLTNLRPREVTEILAKKSSEQVASPAAVGPNRSLLSLVS